LPPSVYGGVLSAVLLVQAPSSRPWRYVLGHAGSIEIEQRLVERGLQLPAPMMVPAGVEIPFAWVRVRGDRAYVSGHGALEPGGAPAGPFRKVPKEVSLEEG
jgi:hypothetical protein